MDQTSQHQERITFTTCPNAIHLQFQWQTKPQTVVESNHSLRHPRLILIPSTIWWWPLTQQIWAKTKQVKAKKVQEIVHWVKNILEMSELIRISQHLDRVTNICEEIESWWWFASK